MHVLWAAVQLVSGLPDNVLQLSFCTFTQVVCLLRAAILVTPRTSLFRQRCHRRADCTAVTETLRLPYCAPAPPVLQVLVLPEALQASIMSLAGLSPAARLSCSCRTLCKQLWDSPVVWRSLLTLLLGNEAWHAHCSGGHAPVPLEPDATELRSAFRRRHFGIDELSCTTSVALRARHQKSTGFLGLEAARRAVLVLKPEDGALVIERATESVANVLRHRAQGSLERRRAAALLEAVASKAGDVFSTEQMLGMLGAEQMVSR